MEDTKIKNKETSTWNKEIKIPFMDILNRMYPFLSFWAAFFCIGIFIISPFIVGILCLFHHSVDYTIFAHPLIIDYFIWPLSAVAGLTAIVTYLIKRKASVNNLFSWLKNNPVCLYFFCHAIWMFISTCVNGWNQYCLFGDSNHLRFETIFMQFGYFVILFSSSLLINDKNKKIFLIRLHEAVSFFLSIAAFILWKTQINSLFYQWKPGVTAIFSNINYYGYYLSVSIPLSAAMFVEEKKDIWRIFSVAAITTNTIALAYNNTMGGWVACTAAIIFMIIAHIIVEHKPNRQVMYAASVYFLCLIIFGYLSGNLVKNFSSLFSDMFNIAAQAPSSDRAGSGRWLIWKRCLKLISESPLFGIGFEGVCVRELLEFAKNSRPHNEYLQYTLFYGIPSGIAYLAGCISVYFRALHNRANLNSMTLVCLVAAFGYLVSAFFGLTLFATTPYLFIFLGMGYETRS